MSALKFCVGGAQRLARTYHQMNYHKLSLIAGAMNEIYMYTKAKFIIIV